MEEDCGGGQGLSWAVEPRGGGERERQMTEYINGQKPKEQQNHSYPSKGNYK
jgi:hypothetical protein